ncbi:branched-chain amino acid ABC transporter permease [Aureimonas sp. AU12]|uniref:branched-chain amino acid ABC transporter permease n=1 Tax=Aureimonas sp. AU12 TaxID=1638161 RepID=UPI000784011C|nr:branched-chain amino acid ABC transporter permease [Aureimonas sp. AU12]
MRDLVSRHQTPAILVAAVVALVLLGVLTGNETIEVTLTEMFIRLIVVVGLSVFIGNSGIISFGHVGFMCIGAYAAAWATAEPSFKQIMLSGLPVLLQENQYPFALAMVGAVVLPAFVAFLLGLALMRLSGTAASIATFAVLMIVNSVYSNWDSVTAGVSSIIGIPTVVGPWTAALFACAAVVVAHLFQVSRFGLMLRASRDDEVASRASAVDVKRVRLLSFVLSAAIAGAGGGLYAQFLGILTVDPFYLGLSFITLAMLVVGGMSTLSGAVMGVVAVTAITEVLRLFERGSLGVSLPSGSQEIGLGIVMALILVFRPDGLSGGREVRFGRRSRKAVATPAAPAGPLGAKSQAA